MAIIRKNELKQMKEPQLMEKLAELNKELTKAKAQIATHTTPENPGRIKEIKKTIARIYTLLNQPKIEEKEEVKELPKKENKPKEETKKQ